MKKGFSTISTPQCEDRERKAGSGVAIVTYYAESVHLIYFSVFQSDHRRANRYSTWQPREWLPLIAPRIVVEWVNNQRSPHLPPQREIGETLSPPSEGKKPWNGLPIPENGQWIWQVRIEIGTCPSPFPLPNPIAGPAPWGALAKTPSSKRVLRERSVRSGSRSQCGQPAPSRADSACFTPTQTTHRLCVSPLVIKLGQGGTHCLYCELLSPFLDL